MMRCLTHSFDLCVRVFHRFTRVVQGYSLTRDRRFTWPVKNLNAICVILPLCSKWFWDASPPNGYSCLCIVTRVCDLQYLAIRDFASFKKREYLTPYFRDSGKRNFYIRDPWSSRFLFLNRARDSPIRLSSLVGYQLHPLSLLRA